MGFDIAVLRLRRTLPSILQVEDRLMKQLWTDCGWQAFSIVDNSAV